MDRRAGILGIAVPSGPINLSTSQEGSRTALPSGFKRREDSGRKREIPEWLSDRSTILQWPFSRVSITNGTYLAFLVRCPPELPYGSTLVNLE